MKNNFFRFTRKQLAVPYTVFLVFFVLLPLLVVLYYALTDGQGKFTADNFIAFFENGKTIGTLVYSLLIAAATTACCLLLAYPTALLLAKGAFQRVGVLLLLIVMPMWINFTLRITALKEIMSYLEGNLAYHPFLNTILAMTYDFLPFMILPIYNTLAKLDDELIEAAQDLGAGRLQILCKIILPLSMPGILSGVMMVFLPAMTNYVVLDMIYNSTYIMGSLIGSYFNSYDWHNGSMISILLLLLIFVMTWVTDRCRDGEEKERIGGAVL